MSSSGKNRESQRLELPLAQQKGQHNDTLLIATQALHLTLQSGLVTLYLKAPQQLVAVVPVVGIVSALAVFAFLRRQLILKRAAYARAVQLEGPLKTNLHGQAGPGIGDAHVIFPALAIALWIYWMSSNVAVGVIFTGIAALVALVLRAYLP